MVTMQIPQWVARFNKYVTNPVQRIWAGYLPAFAVLEHVGRKSGKTITVSEPRIVPKAEAARQVTGFFRSIFPRLPFDQAVLLRSA